MLISLITLITIVFFGGGNSLDYFLISDLDKGVKKFVVSKEQQKEILAEFKIGKKEIKQLQKSRKATLKALKSINSDRNASREDFNAYHEELLEFITAVQDIILTTRIGVIQNITDGEWDQIMEFSSDNLMKSREKLQAKIDKGKVKDPFDEVKESITKHITDPKKQELALEALDELKESYIQLAGMLNKRNAVDMPVIKNKNSSREELLEIASEVNTLRSQAYEGLVDFHFKLLEYTSDKEWDKVIKSVNKLIN